MSDLFLSFRLAAFFSASVLRDSDHLQLVSYDRACACNHRSRCANICVEAVIRCDFRTFLMQDYRSRHPITIEYGVYITT